MKPRRFSKLWPKLLPILAAGSLGLWLVVAILFVRSFGVSDRWVRTRCDPATLRRTLIESSCGRVGVGWLREQHNDPRWIAECAALAKAPSTGRWCYMPWQPTPGRRTGWYKPSYEQGYGPLYDSLPGFLWWMRGSNATAEIRIPLWPLLLLLAIAPGLWLRRFLRLRRRKRLGLCLVCGYDLRATPERCPECGSAVSGDLVRKPMEGSV